MKLGILQEFGASWTVFMMTLMAWRQLGKYSPDKPTMFSVDLTFAPVEESLQVWQQHPERMKIG
jgi:hypothetical protein